MVSALGDRLVEADAVAAIQRRLLPLATLCTPNRREAALLLGQPDAVPRTRAEVREAARQIRDRFGPQSVLVKGGELESSDDDETTTSVRVVRVDRDDDDKPEEGPLVVDVFYDGTAFLDLVSPRVDTTNTHGTGCTLASAIAARLARGDTLVDAVIHARTYLHRALTASRGFKLGQGDVGPLIHAHASWPK
mmetsp:Transcript_13319/g.53422  ORF Transcript_13319/g.53422 Transcript_13319/m.53422 type:complete len:192 (-) Transcript_13319:1021-1596(-)